MITKSSDKENDNLWTYYSIPNSLAIKPRCIFSLDKKELILFIMKNTAGRKHGEYCVVVKKVHQKTIDSRIGKEVFNAIGYKENIDEFQ